MIELDFATAAAFAAAAAVASRFAPDRKPIAWCSLGEPPRLTSDPTAAMAMFVRGNPAAPAEALWRWTAAHGVHAGDAQGFDAAADADQLPYRVFHAALLAIDAELLALQQLRADRAAREAAAGADPPIAGPADVTGTILERHGTIFEPSAFAPPAGAPKRKGRRRG